MPRRDRRVRALSENARHRLDASGTTMSVSIGEFVALTVLIARLGNKVTSFAAAMSQVRRTTKMLALNAACWEMR